MKRNLPTPQEFIAELQSVQEGTQLNMHLKVSANVLGAVKSDMPEVLDLWLGRLSLLYGVPFEHIIPNPDMLPRESVRFFYVDANWISALQDGALSIATHSTRDETIIKAAYPQLQHSIRAAMKLIRPLLAGAELPAEVSSDIAVSGILIRSQLISGWPGLEIVAYEDYTTDADGKVKGVNPIGNLRIERLSPDVMVCLYPKLPKLVQISEPKEGLAFGLRSDKKLVPRHLGYDGRGNTGGTYGPEHAIDIAYRPDNKGVIKVMATKQLLEEELKKVNGLGPKGTLEPADFAIQLIKTAEQQSFRTQPAQAGLLNN
jgi:hypothetical protein